MGLAPKVQFVRRSGADLAYQVLGNSAANLLYLPMASHLEQLWQFPIVTRGSERLATMSRMALCGHRGVGMSDPLPVGGYALEDFAADALAVMDAAEFDRAVILGEGMSAAVAVWLALHCPDRVEGLILYGGSACWREHPGYRIGMREADVAALREVFQTRWGTGVTVDFLAPSFAGDERLTEEWARYERMMATPNGILALFDALTNLDVREMLPTVSTRTLVIQPAKDG